VWRFCNVQNLQGVKGTNPQQNADNFGEYYSQLFKNIPTPDRPDLSNSYYNDMPNFPVTQTWGEPTEDEMMEAVREVKHTAPGLSGVPMVVWQAIADDLNMRKVILRILQKCWETRE
jgi:hypothetical protein